ncbi:MAG TPA: FAD-binding oxidoreductase [Geminicoccus sp.]|jgi:FAD/FMN-containing dehydrogenase|uniref:FAD-binding oxidoreductase n=1 Tax=Geminicoccus sp. TaxID=2024832 RepID=UPI002E33C46E|nr:FAD-binding oxidoreductase [Geminicoccus sp.]HEX2525086.1 FAD-binding oxidoreductase [Geminicoccus sp.]
MGVSNEGLPPAFLAELGSSLDEGALLTDPVRIAPYLTDFWSLSTGASHLVVRPREVAQVQAVLRACAGHLVPVVTQSGNTGLVGGNIPDGSGRQVVLNLERMNRIREVASSGDYLVAEAGCILQDVQQAADRADRLFPLSLGAEGSCRIGGNIATNAGGINVLRYGMTRRLVLGLEVVLADGTLWQGLRALPKDNTGYDLKQVFIGSEGTLGIITAATLALAPKPRERHDVWLAIETPEAGLELLALFRNRLGETISAFELIADPGVEAAEQAFGARIVEGRHPWHVLVTVAWSFREGLLGHLEGLLEEAMAAELVVDGTIAQNDAQRAVMWKLREGQSEAMTRKGSVWRSDVAVATWQIPELIRRCDEVLPKVRPGIVVFPFGHLGDGNLHVNVLAPAPDRLTAEDRARIQDALFEVVASMGGSFSAEHGIGRWKRPALERLKDPVELALMAKMKGALDPMNLLNPGVITGPAPLP